jgi:Ni,Fe-hydrogenase III large subunit
LARFRIRTQEIAVSLALIDHLAHGLTAGTYGEQ